MGQTGLGGAGRRHVAASVRLVVRRKAAVPVTPSGEHPSLADAKVILAHGGRTQVLYSAGGFADDPHFHSLDPTSREQPDTQFGCEDAEGAAHCIEP
jgi:hypothetical protein